MRPNMSSLPFEVRRLTSADAEAYRAVRLEALRLAPEAYGTDYHTDLAYPPDKFQEWLDTSAIFGALRGADLVGIASLARQETPKLRHKAYLWGVYVRPDARGTGVARSLCLAALDAAKGGIEQVQLTVT